MQIPHLGGEYHSYPGAIDSPDTSTLNTSVSQGTGSGTFQKPN
jgi:hypothetical protein